MTRYGWDVSDYDWARGPMDIELARKQGIDLLTHKISEGTGFTSTHAGTVLDRGAQAGVPVLGGYHVLLPADMASVAAQVSHYVASLTTLFPAWRKHPCFIHQIDAEKFSYMTRRPTLAEIHQFGDGLIEATKCAKTQVIAYAPHWLYGEDLRGLRFALWASAYVSGPGPFKSIYPGDNDSRWAAYSGITPKLLQFASTATIAGQHPSDANAIRVSTVEQLVALFVPKKETDDMTMSKEVADAFDELKKQMADNQDALAREIHSIKNLFHKAGEKQPHHLPKLLEDALDEHDAKKGQK